MPVRPNFLERTAFYTLNAAPAPILDLAGALAYQTLSTAVRLNIFPTLHKRGQSAAELAKTLGLQKRGVQKLLNALTAIGYLTVENGQFQISKLTQKWFFETEIIDMKSMTGAFDVFFQELWPHASEIITSGIRPFDFYNFVSQDPGLSDAFQKTMIGNANIIGPDVVKIINFPQSGGKLLDIGGGHGKFSIQFCQKNPRLSAKIIDSAAALETAKFTITENKLEQRIELAPGDIWEMAWGENYDLILLFNFIHHYEMSTNEKLLSQVFKSLKPGGKVAILDQLDGTVSGSATNAVVQLVGLMYYIFADGRTFSCDEVSAMLSATGFQKISIHSKAKWAGTSLVTAQKGA